MQQTQTFTERSRKQLRVNAVAVLLAGLLSGICSRTSLACLNDREVARGEVEFRSRYDAPPPDAAVEKMTFKPLGWIALGAGAGLSVGSLLVIRERRKRGAV